MNTLKAIVVLALLGSPLCSLALDVQVRILDGSGVQINRSKITDN